MLGASRLAPARLGGPQAPRSAPCTLDVHDRRGSSPATPPPPPTRAKRAAAPSRGCRRSAPSRLGCSCRQGAPPCR
eukprot:7376024-Prymnesium_polylepis.1